LDGLLFRTEVNRSATKLTVGQERQQSLTRNAGRSYQRGNYVQANFIVPGNNQRPGDSGLFHFYVTSFLTGTPVTNLFKNAYQLLPSERG
jgi:hypothetical protein